MQPNLTAPTKRPLHQRYRELLRAGFNPQESAALLALATGITRHAEGESAAWGTWRWQEISRIEFMAHLASTGRLGGPDDGSPDEGGHDVARSGRNR